MVLLLLLLLMVVVVVVEVLLLLLDEVQALGRLPLLGLRLRRQVLLLLLLLLKGKQDLLVLPLGVISRLLETSSQRGRGGSPVLAQELLGLRCVERGGERKRLALACREAAAAAACGGEDRGEKGDREGEREPPSPPGYPQSGEEGTTLRGGSHPGDSRARFRSPACNQKQVRGLVRHTRVPERMVEGVVRVFGVGWGGVGGLGNNRSREEHGIGNKDRVPQGGRCQRAGWVATGAHEAPAAQQGHEQACRGRWGTKEERNGRWAMGDGRWAMGGAPGRVWRLLLLPAPRRLPGVAPIHLC